MSYLWSSIRLSDIVFTSCKRVYCCKAKTQHTNDEATFWQWRQSKLLYQTSMETCYLHHRDRERKRLPFLQVYWYLPTELDYLTSQDAGSDYSAMWEFQISCIYIDHKINMLDTVSFMRIISIEVTMFVEQEVKRHSSHCRIRNTTVNMDRLCHSRRNLRNTSWTGGIIGDR